MDITRMLLDAMEDLRSEEKDPPRLATLRTRDGGLQLARFQGGSFEILELLPQDEIGGAK